MLRINTHPARAQLLVFAIAWLLLLGWAALSLWASGHALWSAIAAVLGLAMPVLWLISNELVRLAFVGLSYATFPLGFVTSYLVLGLIYYLVITPVGLLMRLFGRDPLQRRFDAAATTYWEPRTERRAPPDYLRQR